MPPSNRRPSRLVLLAALAFLPSAGAGAGELGYRTVAEIDAIVDGWARNHPRLVEVETVGRSAGDRPLRVVRLATAGERPIVERPAVFVGANIAGHHHPGSEAVLHLGETLLESAGGESSPLRDRVFYLAPVLNPDAHDSRFARPRWVRTLNAQPIDQDRDGLEGEDGPDDLDGDGRITWMRIADPRGTFLPHPDEPRLMVEADPARGWVGAYRLLREGRDDDGDGEFNEDGPGGVAPDRNFAHAFPYAEPEAGPWPGYAPEVHALFEVFTRRPQIVLAVVYGPANNLLALPAQLGPGGGDPGTDTFPLPPGMAEFLGLEEGEEYTLDEVWEVARHQSVVRNNNITKEQFTQFIGVGPANKLEQHDQTLFEKLAKEYKERLEEAALDVERPAEQYHGGGLTPWLYYQFGALALELDVWGIPEPEPAGEEADEEPLTVDRLAEMTVEDFLALGEEAIGAFLEEIGAPPQITAASLISRVESGQVTPAQMAAMIRQTGAGGGGGEAGEDGDGAKVERQRQVLAWVDANAPEAFAGWTAVTLPDGTRAEVGGLDPSIELAPPRRHLEPALEVHTAWVLDLVQRLARTEIVELRASALGGGVYRVEAVGRNTGEWATHTQMSVRARNRLPVRLQLETGEGVELLTGRAVATSDRLEPGATIEGRWLVRGRPGADLRVRLLAPGAAAERSLTLGREVR